MHKTTISYKSKNILIEKLEKQSNIEVIKAKSFFSKLFSKKQHADIYFHTGSLNEESIDNIKNSKITIVNSFSAKNEIIENIKIEDEKIEVIYPSINIDFKEPNEIKAKICEELQILPETKLIFFTAKNIKSSGIKEFLDICASLNYEDFKIIISANQKQINNLQFQLPKYEGLKDKLIILEDYKNIDDLFLASDIFILPTYNKSFSSNILKAMFCKCVVFVTIQNEVKEVVDVFASMDNPSDSSISFKLDAILSAENDLKEIKEQNRKLALEFTLENNLVKINHIIENV